MQPTSAQAHGDIASFAIVPPIVDCIQRALEIELSGSVERQSAIADVSLILRRIVRDTHGL